MNQSNVSQFVRSFNNRGPLEVERPIPGGNITARTLKLVQPLTFNNLKQIHYNQDQYVCHHASLCQFLLSLSVSRCSTLLVVGDNSPAVEAVVECNSKLNPTKTTLLKVTQ